jgi:DNA invertase Pin-like site-specific DNA recombinase
VGENPAQQSLYLLPKDLAGALERLDDTEVDTLLAAVTTEAEHRGRLPRGSPPNTSASSTKRAPADDGARSLTKGKLNAVRAAFKAGVKPSAIARQFGISQSDVRKALATEGRDRKSWG